MIMEGGGGEMISIISNSWKESKVKRWIRKALKRIKEKRSELAPQQVEHYLLIWKRIFFISSLIGISLDPFILYFPIIQKDNKCLGLDKTLLFIILSLRSFTDLFYLIDIICQIHSLVLLKKRRRRSSSSAAINDDQPHQDESFAHHQQGQDNKERRSSSIMSEKAKKVLIGITHNPHQLCDLIINILAIIPVTQVIVLCFISKIRSSKYEWNKGNARMVLNILLFLQYLPRSCRIIILFLRLKSRATNRAFNAWVQAFLNLFLYLTASHVTGAFWYVFSIERETTCWYIACENHPECHVSDFECHSNSKKDLSFLNDSCPINPPNSTIFDFGIFIDAIQSDTLDSIALPTKFMRCLRWGLRNLSSFGSNLEPSTGIFETSFVASICVFGLVLFIYLIGNVQTFMQFEATKVEETRLKMNLKEVDVKLWINSHDLKIDDYISRIMPKVQYYLKKNKEVDVDQHMFDLLDLKDKTSIKRSLVPVSKLRKISMLKNMGKEVLEEIIEHMEPVTYSRHSYVVHDGEPLGLMLFIRRGTAWTFKSINSSGNIIIPGPLHAECLKEDNFFGSELVEWATWFSSVFGDFAVPMSPTNIKTHKNVEAFAITYEDLKTIVRKFWSEFSKQKTLLDRTSPKVQLMAVSVIQSAWHRHIHSKEIALANARRFSIA